MELPEKMETGGPKKLSHCERPSNFHSKNTPRASWQARRVQREREWKAVETERDVISQIDAGPILEGEAGPTTSSCLSPWPPSPTPRFGDLPCLSYAP